MTSQAKTPTPAPRTFAQALDAYRDAVATRAYWEDNGSRGDGHLEAARAEERAARRLVLLLSGGAA